MTNAFKAFLHSPWSRHPSFLLRKIRAKLGAKFPLVLRPRPAGAGRCAALPVEGLRAWIAACDPGNEIPPWTRVFEQDFPLEFLLERCHASKPLDPENLATLTRDGRGLGDDIKLPWEFSRGYSFVLQAAVAPPDRRDDVARDIAEKILVWDEHNRDLDGPNWICAMEVALRAVNWSCADALLEGALSRQIGAERWLDWLWTCGQVIEQRLEARKVSSNHYLADLLGLSVLGLHFPDTEEGRRWRRFGVAEMPKALLRQTYHDGGLYESSLPYHALVTEMALLFALFAEAPLAPRFRQRLKSMCDIVAATLDVGGDVFPLGDDDSGRILPLDSLSRDLGRGQVLLQLAEQIFPEDHFEKPASAFFPRSGWWICRRGDFEVCLEFGGYGPCGYGPHAHNDTLSVLVNYKGGRVFADPGTYLYTSDPEARNRFRSARTHNVMLFDDREPFPLPADLPGLFRLPGPDRPARVMARDDHWIEVEFAPRGGPGWRRRVEVGTDTVSIQDRWTHRAGGTVEWSFTLAPGVTALTEAAGRFRLETAAGPLWLVGSTAALRCEVADGEYSPGYGRRCATNTLRIALKTCAASGTMTWTLTNKKPESQAP